MFLIYLSLSFLLGIFLSFFLSFFLAVSIGLFWFYFASFSYNEVYFLWFIPFWLTMTSLTESNIFHCTKTNKMWEKYSYGDYFSFFLSFFLWFPMFPNITYFFLSVCLFVTRSVRKSEPSHNLKFFDCLWQIAFPRKLFCTKNEKGSLFSPSHTHTHTHTQNFLRWLLILSIFSILNKYVNRNVSQIYLKEREREREKDRYTNRQ